MGVERDEIVFRGVGFIVILSILDLIRDYVMKRYIENEFFFLVERI